MISTDKTRSIRVDSPAVITLHTLSGIPAACTGRQNGTRHSLPEVKQRSKVKDTDVACTDILLEETSIATGCKLCSGQIVRKCFSRLFQVLSVRDNSNIRLLKH